VPPAFPRPHPFRAADATNWSEFTTTLVASPELVAQFTTACAAENVVVTAAANAKGAVVITKATRSAGAPAGVLPWEVVKDVAPAVFGRCTSVAATKGGAPRPISINTPPPPPPRRHPAISHPLRSPPLQRLDSPLLPAGARAPSAHQTLPIPSSPQIPTPDIPRARAADCPPHRVVYRTGHASGSSDTVLLKHEKSGRFLTAQRRGGFLHAFRVQRGRRGSLNEWAWTTGVLTTSAAYTFKEPTDGFREGAAFRDGSTHYTIVAYSDSGWKETWNDIVSPK
jgi:hypothetical protein